MKIVFIGNVIFSYETLQEVLKLKSNVVGIVTKKENGSNSDYIDLTQIANKYGIPIFYSNNINDDETFNFISNLSPDVIFCFGFSQIIKKRLLDLPPKGVIGYHPADLPNNRGRHPIIWALFLGLEKTASTFFKMDEGADSGPILTQKEIVINKEDNAYTLYVKLVQVARNQIREFLPILENNQEVFVLQDNSKANYWRKRTELDGVIDWRMSSEAIINLTRALYRPYPGAKFKYKNNEIILWKVKKIEKNFFYKNIEPGKIVDYENNKPIIKCYDALLLLEEFEPNINFSIGDYLL